MVGKLLSRATGAALVAAPAMLLWLMPAPASAAPALRPVAAQSSDMSCGLAALANLLNWSGKPVTEAELTALYDARVAGGDSGAMARLRNQGASAQELVALVSALDSGLVLEPAMVTLEVARSLASRESYIAFLVEGTSGGSARSHFTIIAGHSPARGWLRADSIGGRHFRQSEDDFRQAAMIQRSGTRILILRLRKGEQAAVLPEAGAAIENGQIPWIAASRMLSNLARSDAIYARLEFGHYRDRYEAGGAVFHSAATAATLSASIPVSSRLTADVSVPFVTGNLQLAIPGADKFDLGSQSEFGPVGLGLSHSFKAGKDSLSEVVVSGSVRLGRNVAPVGWSLRSGINRPVGKRTIIGGQIALDFDKTTDGWTKALTPSFSVIRSLGGQILASADISATFPLKSGARPTVAATIGVSRQLGNAWAIGVNAGGTVSSTAGHRSRSIGFSITRRIGIRHSEK